MDTQASPVALKVLVIMRVQTCLLCMIASTSCRRPWQLRPVRGPMVAPCRPRRLWGTALSKSQWGRTAWPPTLWNRRDFPQSPAPAVQRGADHRALHRLTVSFSMLRCSAAAVWLAAVLPSRALLTLYGNTCGPVCCWRCTCPQICCAQAAEHIGAAGPQDICSPLPAQRGRQCD